MREIKSLTGVALVAIMVGAAIAAAPASAMAVTPVSNAKAVAIARTAPAVHKELASHPRVSPTVSRPSAGLTEVRWLHNGEQGVAVVIGPSGRVQRVWTGYQAGWELTRGTPGGVGGLAATWWIWIPLSLAFVLPFADLRRPLSLRNADLAAMLGLSVSFAFFNHANLGMSVPLVYPPLVYLAWRLLTIGRDGVRGTLRPNVRVDWLAWALLPLVVLRVALSFASEFKLDVAGISLGGADRLAHWQPVYGHTMTGADHYGPIAYWAYAPFEALWPYTRQLDPTATHWANVVFDLLLVAAIYALGRQIGGRRLGVILTYGWLTLPLSLVALCSGANDGLVALLVVATLLALARPALAGGLAALAALAKVAPAALVPLLITHPGIGVQATIRRAPRFAIGLAVATAVVMATVLANTSFITFWDRVTYEAHHETPLSIWGMYDPSAHSYVLYVLQSLVRTGALALALVAAIRPRRRDTVQLAALCGAILIAVQLGAYYWLYTYATWFLPLALVAFLAPFGRRAAITTPADSSGALQQDERPMALAGTR